MKRTILLVAGLICALGIIIPAAYADCAPDGTPGDDSITCSGTDDADGVNTGTGTDTVTISSGTVLNAIIAEGAQVTVIVNGTGALDTTAVGNDAIYMPFGGAVIFQGNLNSGWDGIYLDDSGSVNSTGNINALTGVGIFIYGDGSVVSMGNIIAAYNGIYVDGDGSINNTGDVTLNAGEAEYSLYYFGNSGLVLAGSGTIDNTGDINITFDNDSYSGGYFGYGGSGIVLADGGTINNTGDINVHYTGEFDEFIFYGYGIGITMFGGGTINNTGDISADLAGYLVAPNYFFCICDDSETDDVTINNTGDIDALFGIAVLTEGNVSITNVGDIHSNLGEHLDVEDYFFYALQTAALYVIAPTTTIHNTGDIDGHAIGIYVPMGSGDITNIGDISTTLAGIALFGDGTITSNGNINVSLDDSGFLEACVEYYGAGSEEYCQEYFQEFYELLYGGITAGIAGGEGAQNVDVTGSINAPIAVMLDGGNDTLNIRPFTVINGVIDMGAGDDVVRVGNYAVVTDTMFGGEDEEVVGDLLILGAGQVCSEDPGALADFAAGIAGLDPNSGTVTYLGQTYTWEEFEMLGHEGFIAPCIGFIHDGRINAYDLGAPEALYCTVEHGVSVWELNLEGQGTFSFAISRAQIVAAFEAAVASGQNQLIGEDALGNQLYAISDGHTITFVSPELREAGKQYLFSFEKDRCGEEEA
jgi:hypothetical protein